MKELKIWNGRGHGKKFDRGHIYVAAYSMKQAAELISKACQAHVTVSEINVYFSKGAWGDPMNGIIPTEPCVYASELYFGKPEKIL
jgi:hypothetical protein